MTEEKDGAVHYQVSITGRQAAGFFFLLLLALGLSFFFGMKTGAAAKRGPDPLTRIADGSDIAVPTVEPERRPAEKPAAEAKEPVLGFPPETPVREAKPTRAPEPTPEKAEKTPPPAEAPERTPVPQPTAAAAEKPAEKPAPKGEKTGPFWVQVFVTKSAEKADSIAKKLEQDGFSADVSLVPGKKDLFRVRSGPYPDRAKADAAAKRIEKLEKLETRVGG